jgi:hypothetical protein
LNSSRPPLRGVLDLEQIDRCRDRDREAESGVAVVAGEQQQQRGEERDEHGYTPGNAVDGHLVIVADAAVRARC